MVQESIRERAGRLELPFNTFGIDPYGISRDHVAAGMQLFGFFYRHYFSMQSHGLEHVPRRGRVMLVGNHSGGVAIDGAMVIATMFFELDPPRLAQGMAEKFINRFPFASIWTSRTGQFTGLPETAQRLLEDDRMLVVFPEGARGTAKLWKQRYSLVEFGTGFMRLALATRTPIVPFGFVGGADAVPTIANEKMLARLIGVPYLPVTPYLLPVPRPVPLEAHYGEPMLFEGTGNEDDETVYRYVGQVKARIDDLVQRARSTRRQRMGWE